jgi:hypothetical protein
VSDLFNFVGFAGGVILHRRASARGAARISRTSREVDGGIGVSKMHHRWGIERRGKYPSPPFFHRSFYTIALQAPSLDPLPLAVSLSQISRCARTIFRLLGSEGPHATRTIVTTSWYLLQTFEMRRCLKPTTLTNLSPIHPSPFAVNPGVCCRHGQSTVLYNARRIKDESRMKRGERTIARCSIGIPLVIAARLCISILVTGRPQQGRVPFEV